MPDVVELADALDELASFLATNNERTWANWIAKDAIWVRRGDGYGVTHFLSAFGGMGSLNDLVFDEMNGNASRDDVAELNATFARLRGAAWEQAMALRESAID